MDYEKAFDSVHRETLWRIIQSYGISITEFIRMVKLCNNNTKCAVLDGAVNSDWFTVKAGVITRLRDVRVPLPVGDRLDHA